MGERNFGARWWRESLGIARWASRPAMGTMGLLGALSLAGCATSWGEQRLEETQLTDAQDDVTVSVNALQLQRNEGWDVGQRGATLAFPDSTDLDKLKIIDFLKNLKYDGVLGRTEFDEKGDTLNKAVTVYLAKDGKFTPVP